MGGLVDTLTSGTLCEIFKEISGIEWVICEKGSTSNARIPEIQSVFTLGRLRLSVSPFVLRSPVAFRSTFRGLSLGSTPICTISSGGIQAPYFAALFLAFSHSDLH